MRVSNGARNAELDLRAGIRLAPHIQAPSDKFGAFAHAVQAVMSGLPVLGENLWVDAFSVIANAHPELPVIVPDFHFDLLCLCMLECIAHRLAGDPEHFVAEDWMEVPRGALDLHAEGSGRLVVRLC